MQFELVFSTTISSISQKLASQYIIRADI